MPIYFFHVRDGELLLKDGDGTDLPSLDAAVVEARESAREIAADSLRSKERVDGRTIEITTAEGQILNTVCMRDVLDI
ncbi:MAG: hypothetical protein JWQ19_3894 [Subtercola sp.]|nr:hypothetical protein [Subtercola sp.]